MGRKDLRDFERRFIVGAQMAGASVSTIAWKLLSADDLMSMMLVNKSRQLYREGYYSRVAVHKPLITKTSAHLRVQWCKNHRRWSTEIDTHTPTPPAPPSCSQNGYGGEHKAHSVYPRCTYITYRVTIKHGVQPSDIRAD
uniref:Transposase Tc1-like domain-containing protein n=1 Tax=Lates calcarifer TaxID=8187 RepID=A0A4W6E7F5_LATCA